MFGCDESRHSLVCQRATVDLEIDDKRLTSIEAAEHRLGAGLARFGRVVKGRIVANGLGSVRA
jgi:hypothetical protein